MSNSKNPQEPTSDLWFTKHFGIDKHQWELPFIDFRLDRDVPLYIDPYALAKDPSDIGVTCTNKIVDYFEVLLSAAVKGDSQNVRKLIKGRLSEPGQICLGVGRSAEAGQGIGPFQEGQIVTALTSSSAAKAGMIHAIQEMELHIPLVGPDKISDLVANIILDQLAIFTEEMCETYGVPTRPCAVDGFWDVQNRHWDSGFFNLPTIGTTRSLVLVPRRFVRRDRDLMNHREFYDHYILDTLQRELLTADDSLVEVLQRGRRRVTKKSIREDDRFKPTKQMISQFILDHPDVIDEYRADLTSAFRPADPGDFSGKAQEDDSAVRNALEQLEQIKPGRTEANNYHDCAFLLLQFVFDHYLENFEKEYKMDGGRGRLDIVADNFATGGFFYDARQEYDAKSVPMECKNYTSDLGNEEFNQIVDRLGPKTSRIGLILCRKIENRESIARHATDRWLRHGHLIIVIDDAVLKELVRRRLSRDFKGLDAELRRLARAVHYGNSG